MQKFSFFLLLLVLFSCGDRGIDENLKSRLDDENLVLECKAFIEEQDILVDSQGQRFESLVYTSAWEECKSILFYYNDSLSVLREWKRNPESHVDHEISYYFKSGALYLVQDIMDSMKQDGTLKSTELLIYHEQGKPVKAWFNNAENGYFDHADYQTTKVKTYTPNRALDMFYHEGNFGLNFDSFLTSGSDLFLLVNSGAQKEFVSAIKINEMDTFLKNLQANPDKFKNKPLKIEHQAVSQEGWLFHYYISGRFKE